MADWWVANQNMLSALTWSGYEVDHAWGEGGHNGKHAAIIMANALAWLWKDYPMPVQTHPGTTPRLNPVIEGESWKEVPLKSGRIDKLAVNKAGEVFFTDRQAIYKTDISGALTTFAKLKGEPGGMSFDPNGMLYAGDLQQNKIVAIGQKGVAQDIVTNVHADFLTLSSKGVYFAETSKGRVGFYSFAGKEIRYSAVPGGPTGLAISAEQTFLSVGVANGVLGYSFRIGEDGNLDFGQDYIHYHLPYGAATPGTAGMTVDADNLLYSVTAMGIQLSDQLGRVNFIFSMPAESAVDVKFGGGDFSTLYVAGNGKLFSRKIKAKGILSWLPPVKPPKAGM
jgi:gluconolactonase